MLPHTNAFLAANPDIWDDSGFAFGYGENSYGSMGRTAVLSFFGSSKIVRSRSGNGAQELLVTQAALQEIDAAAGHRVLVKLLSDDLEMFSCRKVEQATLEKLASIFFSEMGICKVYSNNVMGAPKTLVTTHTTDTFICAINDACIAFWLYGYHE